MVLPLQAFCENLIASRTWKLGVVGEVPFGMVQTDLMFARELRRVGQDIWKYGDNNIEISLSRSDISLFTRSQIHPEAENTSRAAICWCTSSAEVKWRVQKEHMKSSDIVRANCMDG